MISNSEVEQVNSLLDYKVKVISSSKFIKEVTEWKRYIVSLIFPSDGLSSLGLCTDYLRQLENLAKCWAF